MLERGSSADRRPVRSPACLQHDAVRELQASLWHWQAPHPDWTPSERRDSGEPAVPSYLVERYLPGLSADEVHAATQRLEAVTKEMAAEGITIRYLSSAYVAEEESCFCQLEAPSREAVAAANERAAFGFARVLAADLSAPQLHEEERCSSGCAVCAASAAS